MDSGFSAEIQALAQRQAALSKVFSSAQRVLILWFLAEKERKVSEIAVALGASLPSTSQHLRLMELNDVLVSRREKQNIYYRLADNDLLRSCLVLANLPKEQLAETRPGIMITNRQKENK
jgi:ArsR family transcriptional regulator, virulence genes transcriptional regulator